MERTESLVVQVAPASENNKIKEMEMFGWSLQNRQEIHEEGDAYIDSDYGGSSYTIKTKVYHYVKLHFSRDLGIPNLGQIQQIEQEYFNVPFPASPPLTWPVIFTFFFVFTTISSFAVIFAPGATFGPVAGAMAIFAVPAVLSLLWLKSRVKKRKATKQTCDQSLQRIEELIAQLQAIA